MTMQLISDALQPSGEMDELARRRRGLLAGAYLRRAARILVERLRAFADARATERECRKAILELQMLDDRMLADIGLTRGEIEFVVRSNRPFRW